VSSISCGGPASCRQSFVPVSSNAKTCAGRRPAYGSGTCGDVRLRTWADVLSAQGEMCWGVHASLNGEHMGTCAEALRRDVRVGRAQRDISARNDKDKV
jgi:hypothetical protein